MIGPRVICPGGNSTRFQTIVDKASALAGEKIIGAWVPQTFDTLLQHTGILIWRGRYELADPRTFTYIWVKTSGPVRSTRVVRAQAIGIDRACGGGIKADGKGITRETKPYMSKSPSWYWKEAHDHSKPKRICISDRIVRSVRVEIRTSVEAFWVLDKEASRGRFKVPCAVVVEVRFGVEFARRVPEKICH